MFPSIKFTFLIAVCLIFMANAICGQTNSVDDEIKTLENRLIELKKQKIALKKQKIEEEQQEIKKLEAELGGLQKENKETDNTETAMVRTGSSTSSETDRPAVNPTSATALQPAVTSDSQNNPDKTVQGRCARVFLDLENASRFDDNLCRLAEKVVDEGDGKIALRVMSKQVADVLAAKFASVNSSQNPDSDAELRAFFYKFDNKRTDKQVGAGSNSSGTTSLVVKGGTPAIIGWAVENGSATSSISGNTVTMRVNPYNLNNALFRRMSLFQIKDEARNDYQANRYFDLRRLSFGFSFDTTRGTDTPTFIVSKQQLASWSVRYEFINERNPLSKRWKNERNAFFDAQTGNADKIAEAIRKLRNVDKFRSPLLEKWKAEINEELEKIPSTIGRQTRIEMAREVIEKKLNDLSIPALMAEKVEVEVDGAKKTTGQLFTEAVVGFIEGSRGFKTGRDEFLEKVNKGSIATFEYTNNREVNAPDTSNFRFVWEKGMLGKVDFTLNAEMTMFNKNPAAANVKRLKAFNVAFQFDAPLEDVIFLSDSVLSGAIRYTRQQSDVVLPNGVVADGTKGDILFGQVKLTIPIADTGLRLPFSLTFGNRSEFIKEKFTRANFGLTFDLDQIFRPTNLFKSVF